MKVFRLIMSVALVSALFTQCKKDNLMDDPADGDLVTKSAKTPTGSYTVTVENVSTPYDYFASGVQAIPEGKDDAGPALPGETYKFSFHAGPKHKLSFATMFGWSNDGFFAAKDAGISLYDGDTPVTGDITSEIMLWDAGTEENQEPGMDNQHDGANVTDGMVQLMSTVGDGYDYGTVETNLKVTLEYEGGSLFSVTFENLAESKTPISPVVWVVHYEDQYPIFKEGEMDYGKGLEDVAETGNPGTISSYLKMKSGYVSPIAPVLWVLHGKKYDRDELRGRHGRGHYREHERGRYSKNDNKSDMPIFTEGMPDYGMGLEILAETGNPEPLYESLMEDGYETGFQATRVGGGNGPLFPGQMYEFTIEGYVGQSLSVASMLGASNDIFFSTGDEGIKLSNGIAEKDITHLVKLYDAGTEVNEYPGAQTQANTDENGNVRLLDDGLPWPDASQVIKVTIRRNW